MLTEFGIAEDLMKIASHISTTEDPRKSIPRLQNVNNAIGEETCKLFERMSRLNAETMFELGPMVKDEERLDSQFRHYFDGFKKEFETWMTWHIAISKSSKDGIPFDMGKTFEKKIGIDLDLITPPSE